MSQILLFLCMLAMGVVLRVAYWLFGLVAKRTRLAFMRYVMDALFVIVAFSALVAFVFFIANGKFHAFMLLGLFAGLGLCQIPFSLFPSAQKPLPQGHRDDHGDGDDGSRQSNSKHAL